MLGKIVSLPHGRKDRADPPMMGREVKPKTSEGEEQKRRGRNEKMN